MTMRMRVFFQARDVGDADPEQAGDVHGFEGSQRVGQAVVQHGGVDAAGQGPQLGDRLDGAAVGVLHQLGDPGEVGWGGVVELLLGQAELHGQGHQLGLRAVVQVAFDVAEPGRRVVHRVCSGLLQIADPLGERGGVARSGSEQAADERSVHLGDRVRQPRGREQQDRAERQEQERAG